MNRRSILTKTGKGLMEATGKTSSLSRDLRNVLKEIDGKVSVSVLLERLDKVAEPRLLEALAGLERDGYVREFLGPQDTGEYAPVGRAPISQAPSELGEDLDFTSFNPAKSVPRQREEASAKAKAEALARAKIEAEQKARAALAQQLRPESRPPPSQDSGQARALDQARREAEERQRRGSEEKGRHEAEARARIEAEERVRREAEERQRAELKERTRREDEETARRETEARVRREAEERARKEIEDRRRREIEDKLRQEEVERRLREEQERARREAEEKERRKREAREHAELMVRVEAEARAKVEAEEHARREREERARRAEEEGRRRKEAQEREARERMREQEEATRRELEEKIREEEERERREQEQRARGEEEEKAVAEEEEDILKDEEEEAFAKEEARRVKEEAKQAREEERARAKEAEHTRSAHRSRERAGEEVFRGDEGALVQERARAARRAGDWRKERSGSPTKTIVVMLLIILVVAAAVIPFVPIESAPYEKAAQDWLGVPVKIGSTGVTLVPSPQLKFEKVVIGSNPQMRIATVKAMPEIASLLGDKKAFRSLELEGVAFPSKYLPVFLSDKGKGNSLRVAKISAKGLKLDIPDLNLPPLDVNARLGADGAVQSVVLSNAERKLSVILTPQGRRAAIEISADAFPLPIGGDLVLDEFLAKGTVTAGELALSEVEARAFGGRLQGNARVRWTDGWALDGEVSARGVEAAKLAAPILAGGVLEGKGTYGMKASVPEKLFASARFEGNFNIQKGSITNVDMTRLLQGSSTGGGTTLFSDMSGAVSADSNRLAVRQLRLAAGLLNGAGQAEMDSQKNLSGRMQIELRAQSVQARATLGIGGTLKNPQFRRAN